jgi:hypothetical protein
MRTALIESNVSLCCEVNCAGKVRWWATVESGRMPAQCSVPSCRRCSWANYPLHVTRRSRLVVKSEGFLNGLHSDVVIAGLDVESVKTVALRVAPLLVKSVLEASCSLSGISAKQQVLDMLCLGMFTKGLLCGCVPPANCMECVWLAGKKQGRFSQLLRWYDGCGVKAPEYWDYVGVSDTVGSVWERGRERVWLSCPFS